jgi:hypothetical protein
VQAVRKQTRRMTPLTARREMELRSIIKPTLGRPGPRA